MEIAGSEKREVPGRCGGQDDPGPLSPFYLSFLSLLVFFHTFSLFFAYLLFIFFFPLFNFRPFFFPPLPTLSLYPVSFLTPYTLLNLPSPTSTSSSYFSSSLLLFPHFANLSPHTPYSLSPHPLLLSPLSLAKMSALSLSVKR